MKNTSKPPGNTLIIAEEDYETINNYVNGLNWVHSFDKKNAALLKEELKKATLVKKDDLPQDVVGLNSRVIIKDKERNKLLDLVLVVPELADIKQGRISVFAPIGTALIGFRQGTKIKWEVPSGNKTFTILEVYNPQKQEKF
ncbi:MAG: GreA/GreB family elongation factor [Ferruginibacter sp.]